MQLHDFDTEHPAVIAARQNVEKAKAGRVVAQGPEGRRRTTTCRGTCGGAVGASTSRHRRDGVCSMAWRAALRRPSPWELGAMVATRAARCVLVKSQDLRSRQPERLQHPGRIHGIHLSRRPQYNGSPRLDGRVVPTPQRHPQIALVLDALVDDRDNRLPYFRVVGSLEQQT